MSLILSIIIFLIALSIIVLLHEFGHFLMAKKFGVKVLEFGLGFPPRVWSKQVGETIYSINAFPLGGFVRLLGEDEADKDSLQTEKEREEWKTRSFSMKPAWQRMIVAVAGVVMNVLMAWVIFTIVLLVQGFSYRIPLDIPFHFVGVEQTNKNAVVIAQVDNKALAKTLTSGDEVISVNGQSINGYDQFQQALLQNKGKSVSLSVSDITDQGEQPQPKKIKTIPLQPLDNPAIEILEVSSGSPADKAGLKAGDLITEVNGQPIEGLDTFSKQMKADGGKELTFTLLNSQDNTTREVTVTPRVNPPAGQGALGVGIDETVVPGVQVQEVPLAYLNYRTPSQKVFSGLIQGYNELSYTMSDLSQRIATSITTHNVGPTSEAFHGIIAIGYVSDIILKQSNAVLKYLDLMGQIALSLAFFNILPLPALDGGRIFFMLIETVFGKKVNPKIEGKIHYIGFMILIGLTVLIAYNDIQQFIWPNIVHLFTR